MAGRIGRWARRSLLLALGLAGLGLYLRRSGMAPFWGDLLLAFGEAALVGGLADWFAVRALFAHPLGLPFPHTALIPRNRRRITCEIANLVLNEWLPVSLLKARVETFDFVRSGLLPAAERLRPRLREMLREVGRELLDRAAPADLAGLVSGSLAGSLDAVQTRQFLADLLRGARERHLLDPLLNAGIRRMTEWAGEPGTWHLIRRHLERATNAYQERGLARTLAFSMAELFGGVDLDGAAADLQREIQRFFHNQLYGPSPLKQAVESGLVEVEAQMRDDQRYLDELRAAVLSDDGTGSLTALIESVLSALRQEGLRELDRADSRLMSAALSFLDGWLTRLENDVKLRDPVNDWCRRMAATMVERHHPLLGRLVEEQMNRTTDASLTALIESRVGEDLNWIRLNGTFVGGLIGVALFLLYRLITMG